jgi:hypothetical protein
MPRSRKVELYLHSRIHLHGVVKHRDNFAFYLASLHISDPDILLTERIYSSDMNIFP